MQATLIPNGPLCESIVHNGNCAFIMMRKQQLLQKSAQQIIIEQNQSPQLLVFELDSDVL